MIHLVVEFREKNFLKLDKTKRIEYYECHLKAGIKFKVNSRP